MIKAIVITILIIIGVIVETLLIGNTLIALRTLDNEQECDKEFWEDEECLSCQQGKEK